MDREQVREMIRNYSNLFMHYTHEIPRLQRVMHTLQYSLITDPSNRDRYNQEIDNVRAELRFAENMENYYGNLLQQIRGFPSAITNRESERPPRHQEHEGEENIPPQ